MNYVQYILLVIYLIITFYLGYYMGGREVKKKYGIDTHDVIIAISSDNINEHTISEIAKDLRKIKENVYEQQRE